MTEETAAIDAARKKGKGALNELHGAHGERRENTKDDWRGEGIMRTIPWQAYVSAVGGADQVDREALFIHGDLDEIPNAAAVKAFRHCVPKVPLNTHPGSFRTSMFRYTLDYYSLSGAYGDGFPNIFRATDAMLQGGGAMPRMYKSHQLTTPLGYHVNRFQNVYGELFKDFAIAEGGFFYKQMSLTDPYTLDGVRLKGIRPCCDRDARDAGSTAVSSPLRPLPWYKSTSLYHSHSV
jgi:hypothetical protein